MLRWATIHKKLVARLCATLVASGSLVMAGEIKKNRHPIRRVSAEEAAVEVAEATEAAEPVDFAETDDDAVPAELAQAERAADREQIAGETEAADDGADVFDAALHPDPWCAPGAFTGPRQPSQYDSQMQNAIQNPQAAMNQPRYTFGDSGGQNYVSAGASRSVPAFMGDAFGGGGYQSVCLPTLREDLLNVLTIDHVASLSTGFGLVDPPEAWSLNAGGYAVNSGVHVGVSTNYASVQSTLPLINPTTHVVFPGSTFDDDQKRAFGFKFTSTSAAFMSDVYGSLTTGGKLNVNRSGSLIMLGGSVTKYQGPSSPKEITNDDYFYGTMDATFVPVEKVYLPLSSTAGRVKLSENSSPIPRDRILVNYSYFSNVGLTQGGVNVNRITPGFEKTLFSKNASIEVRTPMAVTLDQDIQLNSTNSGISQGFNQVEFGDVTCTLKVLFAETDAIALSGGLGMALPTSDDISARLANGVEALRINHKTMHLMPFVGGVFAPNDRFFGQWIAQVDVPTGGDPTLVNLDPNGLMSGSVTPGLNQIGKLTDPTFLYLDLNAGYWTYRNEDVEADGLTGLAVMSELHYNRSLGNFDQVTASVPGNSVGPANKGIVVGDNSLYVEQLTFIIGGVAEIGGNSVVSTGYAVPLTGNSLFDGEFRLTYNYYFGRSSRRVNQFGNRPPGLL